MDNFKPSVLLKSLCENEVEFILIGGVAAAVLGLARATFDLDIVYRHTQANCKALASALEPYNPYLREMPPGLPFKLDEVALFNGTNFTLTTSIGDIDLLAEIPGARNFDELAANSERVVAFDCSIQCVTLDKLIELKRSAGRPKDFEMLAQLERLKETR